MMDTSLTAEIPLKEYMPYYYSIQSNDVTVSVEPPNFTTLNTLYITDNLPAGIYVVTMGFAWSMPDTNDSALFVMRSTPSISDEVVQQYEPSDLEDRVMRTIGFPVDYAGGPITITLEASVTQGAQPLTIYYSSLEFERKK